MHFVRGAKKARNPVSISWVRARASQSIVWREVPTSAWTCWVKVEEVVAFEGTLKKVVLWLGNDARMLLKLFPEAPHMLGS